MDTAWRTALWRQFGAAIDMLDNTLVAGPASLWTQRLWPTPRHRRSRRRSLSLFLGQHALPDADLDWGSRAKGDPGRH